MISPCTLAMPDFDLGNAPLLVSREAARIWVVSDIQQSDPRLALEFLSTAIDDLQELDLNLDAVWILGDALRGPDLRALEEVAEIFISQMARLNLPVCYLLGNHDMDLQRTERLNRFPLWERARREKNWSVADKLDDFFFARRFGKCLVLFLGDHADPEGSWFTTHGYADEKTPGLYPHPLSSYARLNQSLSDFQGPVVIASHYAVAGGQKPSDLLNQLLPLPENVKLFLHGHAHIGDLTWNKEDPWERDHIVTGQLLRQVNISALESTRSPGSHSALLELGPLGPLNLRIRNHQDRSWLESYL